MGEVQVLAINLDDKEFVKKLSNALDQITKMGEAKNVDPLIGSLKQIGKYAAVIGTAYLALKGTFDTLFEAERIRAADAQFNTLAANAGLAADKLKDEFLKSTDGLVENTKAIEMASSAITKFGSNASRIPEIMNLARKVSSVTGQELGATFENMSNAIAFGNQKMLKQYGLTVDVDKAMQRFAASIGVTADSLSEAGKQQAILNATLEVGGKKFKGVNGDIKEGTNQWIRLKNILEDVKEIFILLFEKTIGPLLKGLIGTMSELASKTKMFLTSMFGEGRAKAEADIQILQKRIVELKKEMETEPNVRFNKYGEAIRPIETVEQRNKRLNESLAATQTRLDELTKNFQETYGTADKAINKTTESLVKQQAVRDQEVKFEKEMNAMRQQGVDSSIKLMQTEEEYATAMRQRKMLANAEYENQLQAIAQNKELTEQQRLLMSEQAAYNHELKMRQMEQETTEFHEQMMRQRTDASKTASSGMANAFAEGSSKAKKDLTNWGQTGRMVFQSFGNQAVSALQAWGAGTKTASEAAKMFVYGMLADTAEAKGKEMLLASVWPPNPAGLAAGAGLVALSGMLRSQSGGAAKGVGDVGGGSYGGGAGAEAAATAPAVKEEKKAMTNIIIEGNFIETEASQRWITEQIRKSQDATDFTLTKIS